MILHFSLSFQKVQNILTKKTRTILPNDQSWAKIYNDVVDWENQGNYNLEFSKFKEVDNFTVCAPWQPATMRGWDDCLSKVSFDTSMMVFSSRLLVVALPSLMEWKNWLRRKAACEEYFFGFSSISIQTLSLLKVSLYIWKK